MPFAVLTGLLVPVYVRASHEGKAALTDLDRLIQDHAKHYVERTVYAPTPVKCQDDELLEEFCSLACCHQCNDLGSLGG